MNKHIIENRLIDFAVLGIDISKSLYKTETCRYYSDQLIRSTASTALNYGEAQSAESRKDFIHKIKIILKELRESLICLKIIYKANLSRDQKLLDQGMTECNELISIFVKTVVTSINRNTSVS